MFVNPPPATESPEDDRSEEKKERHCRPCPALNARGYGTFSVLLGLAHTAAASRTTTPTYYDLAQIAEYLALWYLLSEWLIFGSVTDRKHLVEPLGCSFVTCIWLYLAREQYLG